MLPTTVEAPRHYHKHIFHVELLSLKLSDVTRHASTFWRQIRTRRTRFPSRAGVLERREFRCEKFRHVRRIHSGGKYRGGSVIGYIIIIKIVLMVQHTYTHTMIKKIKRKYKAMTTEQITDKTYSVQIRRMTDSISSLVSIHWRLSTLYTSISFKTSTLVCSLVEILYICLFQIILPGLNWWLNMLLTSNP